MWWGSHPSQTDADPRQRSDVSVVRVGLVCEAVSAAQAKLPGAAAPQPTALPVEPSRPYPSAALEAAARSGTGAASPAVVSSSDFDVAFITPPTVYRAQQRTDWTGGPGTRSPEVEARIGQLTEFGAWAEYFADLPPVLVVRVTPKMVEGFWKRLAREAARTQGAALPAFKDFKTDFLRMRASCGGVEVAPIHPFVLEHPVSEKDVIREGLYVFDPNAFGPHCGNVTLSLYSEKSTGESRRDRDRSQGDRSDLAGLRPLPHVRPIGRGTRLSPSARSTARTDSSLIRSKPVQITGVGLTAHSTEVN